jgi:hypothetical protein
MRRFGMIAAAALGVAASSGSASFEGGEAQPGGRVGEPSVRVATTGNRSERTKTLPISRRAGAEKRVVMSMPPNRLPSLEEGDRLRATAELQVTVNCFFRSARCVGPIYRYNPHVRARLILARSPRTTGGAGAVTLASPERDTCTQRHPHREHHCVLVFTRAGTDIRRPGRLPCPLDACFVNVVADVHHSRARRGDVVLVGGNRPNGSIPQDRGRINVIRFRHAAPPQFPSERTQGRQDSRLRLNFKRKVVYSKRLNGLDEGEQLAVQARMRTGIAQLPYAVRTSAWLILSDGRRGVKPGNYVERVALSNGEISESNGFNCTQDKGTCLTRKVGVLEMVRDADDAKGRPVPLYVNLVTVFGPKILEAKSGDRVRLKERGGIRVTRFPADLNRGR